MALMFLTAAAALSATLTSADEVTLAKPELRLGDVAALRGAGAERASSLVIARLAPGRAKRLSRGELAGLARRAMPALLVVGPREGEVRIVAPAAAPAATRACFEASSPIAAGEAVTQKNVRAVACSARTAAAVVRVPMRGIAAAAAAIAPGDYLGQLFLGEAPLVERGQKLLLLSRFGPVTISREVEALQPAVAGQDHLFVATSDGEAVRVPLAAGQGR